MNSPSLSPSPDEVVRQRNATRVALVMTILLTFVAALSLTVRLRSGAPLGPGLAAAGLALASMTAVFLCGRHRYQLAMGVIIWAGLLTLAAVTILSTGLGTILAVTFFVVASGIVLQTLPPAVTRWGFLTAFAGGVLILLLDMFWPGVRQPVVAPLDTVVPIVAAGLTIVLGIVVVTQFSTYNLQTKFIIVFLLVTVAPVIILSYLYTRAAQATVTEQANQKLFAAASRAGDQIDGFVEQNLTAIRTEAQLPALVHYLELDDYERRNSVVQAEVTSFLWALSRKDEQFITSYALLDNLGARLLDTAGRGQPGNDFRQVYFQQPIITGEPFVSPVLLIPGADAAQLIFSAPVRNEHGAILGVLKVSYDAAVLQALVEETNALAGPDSFGVLFDEHLVHLAHGTAPATIFTAVVPLGTELTRRLQAASRLPLWPDDELAMDLFPLAAHLETAVERPYFTAEDVATGDRLNQVAVSQLRSRPWQLAFFQPRDVFLAPFDLQRQRTILFAVSIAGLAIIAATVVSQWLARPIVQLTETAVRVAEGDLTARARVTGGDEIGTLARTFNAMTAELQRAVGGLEERVAERTRAVETSARVSRSLSTILDPQQLMLEVVEQVRAAFDYYYAQIYLLEEDGQTLVLTAATGYAGQLMKSRHQRIAVDRGLVGRAARENRTVLVGDVSQSPDWTGNPLLPDTQAEIAVPIAQGGRVLGVLDVQHRDPFGLNLDDAELLESIANQVAVALQNARLYEQAQRRAEQEAQVNAIGQRIQQAATVDDVLQTAAQALGESLPARQVRVRLGSSPANGNGRH